MTSSPAIPSLEVAGSHLVIDLVSEGTPSAAEERFQMGIASPPTPATPPALGVDPFPDELVDRFQSAAVISFCDEMRMAGMTNAMSADDFWETMKSRLGHDAVRVDAKQHAMQFYDAAKRAVERQREELHHAALAPDPSNPSKSIWNLSRFASRHNTDTKAAIRGGDVKRRQPVRPADDAMGNPVSAQVQTHRQRLLQPQAVDPPAARGSEESGLADEREYQRPGGGGSDGAGHSSRRAGKRAAGFLNPLVHWESKKAKTKKKKKRASSKRRKTKGKGNRKVRIMITKPGEDSAAVLDPEDGSDLEPEEQIGRGDSSAHAAVHHHGLPPLEERGKDAAAAAATDMVDLQRPKPAEGMGAEAKQQVAEDHEEEEEEEEEGDWDEDEYEDELPDTMCGVMCEWHACWTLGFMSFVLTLQLALVFTSIAIGVHLIEAFSKLSDNCANRGWRILFIAIFHGLGPMGLIIFLIYEMRLAAITAQNRRDGKDRESDLGEDEKFVMKDYHARHSQKWYAEHHHRSGGGKSPHHGGGGGGNPARHKSMPRLGDIKGRTARTKTVTKKLRTDLIPEAHLPPGVTFKQGTRIIKAKRGDTQKLRRNTYLWRVTEKRRFHIHVIRAQSLQQAVILAEVEGLSKLQDVINTYISISSEDAMEIFIASFEEIRYQGDSITLLRLHHLDPERTLQSQMLRKFSREIFVVVDHKEKRRLLHFGSLMDLGKDMAHEMQTKMKRRATLLKEKAFRLTNKTLERVESHQKESMVRMKALMRSSRPSGDGNYHAEEKRARSAEKNKGGVHVDGDVDRSATADEEKEARRAGGPGGREKGVREEEKDEKA
eukprot:CAMPEP_0167794564 /NCGR_PEP_ID=MMETSP0111_2-20121227/13871_1 /TAXON_ID=91324 /ORGANISM="Lotharella globosa, Strain CCCM811" /LENGTH=829 /DNA_ID=CAMNT_0007687977 /DNA_START=12 /DNA_END=2498 /DNA_ORIENTATION=+